jgi:signal transduction histidine kinase
MSPAFPQRIAVPPLWWGAAVLSLVLALVAGSALWHLRRDAMDGQARELGLLSLALSDEIDRGLRGAEEGLQAMRAELRDGRLPVTGAEAGRALKTRAELMPLVRTLWLLDRDGRILSASDATPAPEVLSFAPALDRLGDDATAVSRPFSGAGARDSLVALAVRFDEAPGSSGGWVLAAMPATALLGAFAVAEPVADARLTVFRGDGVRLAGPIVATPSLDEAGVARHLADPQHMELRRLADGSEHLVALHHLPRYGMTVMLTRNLEAVLVAWREAAQLTTAAMALLVAIMAASIYFVQRADRHRTDAQQALQAQRSRASKLESLGALAGGVAHDFNNVLAAVVGYGEMARDAAEPGGAQARHLDNVMQAALRGKALVERILAFSRGGARTSMVFELEPVVEEVLSLLAASLRPGVVLERGLEAHGALLRGDPTQAFEAVMNLCTNALQAMPEGGMASVQLERVHVDAPRVLSHSALAKGDYLALTVADQGGGITPEVMEHLFEPFFTTRSALSGTGLGLAVVHGVVTEFGGAIDVQSPPGQGARFTLYLPECTDAAGAPAPAETRALTGAGQRLLVVDDNPTLVALAEEMLNALGYAPVGYSDPVAALLALREAPQQFAAVITDEVMPGMSGTELTAALRQQLPQLPVLLISGYGGALLASRAAAAGVSRVLTKPLQRVELAQALADVLRC